MKLISLRDKPATEEDIGKVVYEVNQGRIRERIINKTITSVNDIMNLAGYMFYWQKPVLISGEELKEKSRLLDEAVEILELSINSDNSYFAKERNKFLEKIKEVQGE